MTSSKSNSWIGRALVVFLMLACSVGVANAGGRKRLVVLEFEGDEPAKFQSGLERFLKKNHTIIKLDKWTATADELGATKLSEKNIKKVAKKLKIDGIITGNVEKRRDEYIVRLKLRSGASGGIVGNQVNLKTDVPKLTKEAKGDLRDELFGQIEGLESVRGGGGDDDDEEEPEKPTKLDKKDDEKPAKKDDDEKPSKFGKFGKDDDKPAKKDDDEEKPAKPSKKDDDKAALATKKDDEEKPAKKDDDEERRPKKADKKKGKKKVAARDPDDEDGIEEEADDGPGMARDVALSPGNRAVDGVVGLSFTMRKLGFSYDPNIGNRPPGYKGKPVPGAYVDVAIYPMAFGHKEKGMLKNLGISGMYDKVLVIKSKDGAGNELITEQSRFGIGAVFRYPFGDGAGAPVIGARVRFGKQGFKVENNPLLPNVNYTVIDPGVFFRLPIGQKLVANLNAAFLVIPSTGQIQKMDQYGPATVTGFEGSAGVDYRLAGAIFARASFSFETIGYKFKGTGTRTDGGKVSGARDSFYGGTVTAGYLF